MNVEIDNITKYYGEAKALDRLSFRAEKGEVVGLLGALGSGKSTALKIISCFISPDKGNVVVGDKSVLTDSRFIKKNIGYLPENNPLYENMPIVEYLSFIAKIHQIPKIQRKDRVRNMIKLCGISTQKHKYISELSRGYRQRVGLAQAMIHNPKVLLLDEPVAGLDPNQVVEIRDLICDIGREKTIILSSSLLAEIDATCHRLIVLSKGRAVANGSVEELKRQIGENEILRVGIAGASPEEVYQQLKLLPTIKSVDMDKLNAKLFEVHSQQDAPSAKAIFDLCQRKNWYITQLTPVEKKLEDIFKKLTRN